MLYSLALTAIKQEFGLSSAEAGGLASATLVFSAIGGIAAGVLADRIGRARALIVAVLVYSLATAGTATAQSVSQLLVWRALVGLGLGGEWSAGSVLVAETWPAEHRGKATKSGVRIHHRSGEIQTIYLGRDPDEENVAAPWQRLHHSFERWKHHDAAADPALLEPTGTSSSDWLEHLRRLARDQHGFRAPALSRERLWQIAEDLAAPALARARASGLPSVLHCLIDPEAITPTGTLQGIRSAALSKKK